MRRSPLVTLVAVGLMVAGTVQAASGGWIYVKAWLAQELLEHAWAATLDGDREQRPWPWADTWPVARIEFPVQAVSAIVLSGASGRNLAFAPGHLHGTAAPGRAGATVIAGHRDTHFAVLEDLAIGDEVSLENEAGGWTSYRVEETAVVGASDGASVAGDGSDELFLVTCWPFDDLGASGGERYVVRCARCVYRASVTSSEQL